MHFKGHAQSQIDVKQKPIIVIKPIRSSVRRGERVNVNCNVTNTKKSYLNNDTVMKMCFADNMTEVSSHIFRP